MGTTTDCKDNVRHISTFDILDELSQYKLGNMILSSKYWQVGIADKCPLAYSFNNDVSIDGGNSFSIECNGIMAPIDDDLANKAQRFIDDWDSESISNFQVEQEIYNRIDENDPYHWHNIAKEWMQDGKIGLANVR